MKQTIGLSQFCDAFRDMGRSDNFTHAGKCALFDYLEALEDDIGEEIELDVIGLCCEFTEYETEQELLLCYDLESLDEVRDAATVIEFPGGIIVGEF